MQLPRSNSKSSTAVVITVGSNGDEVQVCDYTLDKTTLGVIANLFHSSTVKMVMCQKQEGGTDCGLYAITGTTAIVHGFDPLNVKINQSAMRSHLVKILCFKEASIKFSSQY